MQVYIMEKLDMRNFLSTEKAAKELGITSRSVRSHISRGNLEAIQVGRAYIIEETELERFMIGREGRRLGEPHLGRPPHPLPEQRS